MFVMFLKRIQFKILFGSLFFFFLGCVSLERIELPALYFEYLRLEGDPVQNSDSEIKSLDCGLLRFDYPDGQKALIDLFAENPNVDGLENFELGVFFVPPFIFDSCLSVKGFPIKKIRNK